MGFEEEREEAVGSVLMVGGSKPSTCTSWARGGWFKVMGIAQEAPR